MDNDDDNNNYDLVKENEDNLSTFTCHQCQQQQPQTLSRPGHQLNEQQIHTFL